VLAVNTVFDRRHAERFAQLLDEADGGRRHHSHSRLDAQLTDYVNLGDQLRSACVPGPPADFRVGLRAQLIAAAQREGIGAADPEEPVFVKPARSRTRIAIIAGIATGALAVSGISMASGNANPGDPLYQVKRSTEKAQLALASSDLSRGQLYLEFAHTRLSEAASVRRSPADFSDAMDDMDSNTIDGISLLTTAAMTHRDQTALDGIDRFVDDQRYLVSRLTSRVDGASQQRVGASVALLDTVSTRSHALRAALACQVGAAAAVDDLGPLAAACPSASASAHTTDSEGSGVLGRLGRAVNGLPGD
jgi:hypothetical protein